MHNRDRKSEESSESRTDSTNKHGHAERESSPHGNSQQFKVFCTMIVSEMSVRWFANERTVQYDNGACHFKEMGTNRTVAISGSYFAMDISRDEFEKYTASESNAKDLIDMIFDNKDECEDCD